MILFYSKPRRQRSKNGKRWPPWLRNSRLLKSVIFIAITLYRLWRYWNRLFGDDDS